MAMLWSAVNRRVPRVALAGSFIGLLVLASSACPVRAQFEVDQLDMTLRPALDATGGIFTVRNNSDQARTVQLALADWDRAEDGGNRFLAPGTVEGTCHPQLEIFPTVAQLGPGESQAVRVTYTGPVPDRLCWSAVEVTAAPLPAEQRAGVQLVVSIVHMIKVYVEPAAGRADIAIDDLDIVPAGTGHGAAPPGSDVMVLVSSRGQLQAVVTGTVEIRDLDDRVVHRARLDDMYILPGARRRATTPLPTLPPGRYVVLVLLDYGGPDIVAGQLDLEIG